MFLKSLLSILQKHIIAIGFMLIIIMMSLSSYYASSKVEQSSLYLAKSNKQYDINKKLIATMAHAAMRRSMLLAEMVKSTDPFLNDELFQKFNSYATTYSLARKKFFSINDDPILEKLLEKQWIIARKNYPLQNKIYDLMLEDKINEATETYHKTESRQIRILYIHNKMEEHLFEKSQQTFEHSKLNNDKVLSTIRNFNIFSILFSLALTLIVLRKKRESDNKLKFQASTDILTQLPNRSNLVENINTYIKQKPSSTFAVLFLDIDYFKNINDNFGHEVGDKVLKKFSETINKTLKYNDVLSRFGGDEFVLLLRSATTKSSITAFVEKLSSSLDTSFIIDENEIFISSSIGVSLYSEDAKDANLLLKYADIAMYLAKESGRNSFSFFSKETSRLIENNHNICHALHTIIKNENSNNELFLMYQPLMNIEEGSITECEALIRWTTKEGKEIPPDIFIPLAEKSKLIENINHFVIDETCKQQLIWQQAGVQNIRININLSGNKLIFTNALNQLRQNINEMNLDASLFGIELTERTLFDISKESINELEEVRNQGMKISIDDFGTGYSSLSYLRKLPITTLKIDKEFISSLSDDNESQILVRTIISLGHSLKLDVVAEGIETYEQFKFLEDNFCNIAQGYYFHRPVDSTVIGDLKCVA